MPTLQELRERRTFIEGRLTTLQKSVGERRSAGKAGLELWSGEEQTEFDSLTAEYDPLVQTIGAEERAVGLEDYINRANEARAQQTGKNGRPNPKLTDPIPGNPADAEFGEFFRDRDGARDFQREERAKTLAMQAWGLNQPLQDEDALKLVHERKLGFGRGDRLNYRSMGTKAQKALTEVLRGNNTAEMRSQAFASDFSQWEPRAMLLEPNRANAIPQGFRDAFEIAFAGKGTILPLCDYVITDDAEVMPFPFVDDTANVGRRVDETVEDPQTGVDPEFVVPKLGTIEFDSDFVKISYNLLSRSPFDFAAMLGTALGERIVRAIDQELIIGPGTAGRFRGLQSRAAIGKSVPVAGAVAIAAIQDLVMSVITEHRNMGTLVLHDEYLAGLVKLTDTTQQFLLGTSNGRVQIGKDMSVPHSVCNWLPAVTGLAATNRPIYFGNFKQMKVRITRDVPIQRFDEIFSKNNLVGFKANRAADADMVRGSSNANCPIKALQLT